MRGFLKDILAFARGRELPSSEPSARPARVTPEHAQKPESLSARLRALGITQSQFSAITGVTSRTVSNWVSGRTKINPSALALLELLEGNHEVRRTLCVGAKAKGQPRGRPFVKGNVYRFGDRRRRVAVAGAQMARAAA